MSKKLSIIILIILFLSIIPIPLVKADDPTSFELMCPYDFVDYGETFNVSVFVSPNASINVLSIDELTYDKTIVNIVAHNVTDNVSQGDIFGSGTTILWRSGVIDNVNGDLTDVAWVITAPGYSGEGYFCNITFEAVGAGSTDINITDAGVSYGENPWEYQIISNVSITVNATFDGTVVTNESTNVEETTATLNGYLAESREPCYVRFEYGTDTSYGTNTSNQTKYPEEEFSYGLTGLTRGQIYHYRAVANDSVGTGNGSDFSFLTKPNPPSGFNSEPFDETTVNLTWSKGNGANKTVIMHKTTGYPASPTDGNEIYNNTGDEYDHTVVSGSTNYYRAWSYSEWDDLYQWSDNYVSDYSKYINYSLVIFVNDTTSIEEETATLHGYVAGHNASYADVGFVYDTTLHADIDDWTYNVTSVSDVSNYTTFSKSISSLQEAEYYYVKAWVHTYEAVPDQHYWNLSDSTEYFLTKPEAPQNLSITTVGDTYLNLSWNETENFGAGTVIQTVVRYKEESYPTSPIGNDGSTLAYNGTDEECTATGLDEDTNYYFRIWSCANASGSPQLFQYSDSFDSIYGSTFEGTYNITVKYENRTYGPVDLTTGHNHQFIIHYSSSTEVNIFNNTGEMDGGNDSIGFWDNVADGWFNVTVDQRPLFFSFHWNESKTYINESGNVTQTNFSCYRAIVPDINQRNITFYIRDDLRVYWDTTDYKDNSLIRYTMSFIDSSGQFVSENNPYATIYTYDDDDNKLVIHSEYFDATRQIVPWLCYDKRYYIGVTCDTLEFERISTFTAADDQNPKIIIPYKYTTEFSFFDLVDVSIGWVDTGFWVDVEETTGYGTSITLYVWWYNNDTLYHDPDPNVWYSDSKNFTVNCNNSTAWKYNIKVEVVDTDPDDNVNYSGTYWLAGENGAAVLLPGIETITSIDDINDIFIIIFGDSPMYDNEGHTVEWAYIGLFGFSFVLLASFGKINAFVGSLTVGLFLMAAGGWIYGIASAVVIVGGFVLGLSIVGLLGGVDTR